MKTNELQKTIDSINDINVLREMREDFNTLCEAREKKLQVMAEAEEIGTGSYWFIKESFENLAESLVKTKEGRTIIKKFVNEHKSNPALKSLYLIYENIATADKNANASELINEMKTFVKEIDFKAVNEAISGLEGILKEAYVSVGETAKNRLSERNRGNLDEAVTYLFQNEKKLDNLTWWGTCTESVQKFISENKENKKGFKKNVDMNAIVEGFNTKFSLETMDEDDFKAVKAINESEDKKGLFEDYKASCIKKIDEAIERNEEQTTCNQLFEFKTRIMKKEYNPDTLGLDIANFIELGKTVSE